MNEHILLVMKWLDDPESVSQEERDKNKEEAANQPADFTTSRYAVAAAYHAATYAARNNQDRAKDFVDRYFEETGESKQLYLDKIKEG